MARVKRSREDGERMLKTRMSFENAVDIRKRHSEGVTINQLRLEYNVSHASVKKILKAEKWRGVELPVFPLFIMPDEPPQQEGVCYKRINGFPGYRIASNAEVWSSYGGSWNVMVTQVSAGGYLRLSLRKKKALYKRSVHSLLAEAFIGPKPKGQVVRHLDDNKMNNSLGNLCYGTQADNSNDSFKNGNRLLGQRHPIAKLTDVDVLRIRERARNGEAITEITKDYNVKHACICKIVLRITWKHLP